MDNLFQEYKDIQNHKTPVIFSWNKALNYLHFPLSSAWREFGEMFIASQPDLTYSPNAYHNQIHAAEAIFSAAILIKEEFNSEECLHYAPYLLFGMMCHDIAHNGSHNIVDYELENMAVKSMKKSLKTLDFQSYWSDNFQEEFGSLSRFQKRIQRLILGTEFNVGIKKNVKTYTHNIENSPFVRINTLANEADIFVSIMNHFSKEKGLLLSIEQKAPTIATKEGQLFFLEHLAYYVSNASQKLGIHNYLSQQIESIKLSHQSLLQI